MLLGRHLVLRHAGVPLRTLKIDGSIWRELDWRRRIASFLVPVLLDVAAVGVLLLVTGFAVPVMTTESVVEPVPDGAAAAAGVLVSDRIVRVEGTPVSTFIEMRDAIANAATENDVLTVELERAGVSHHARDQAPRRISVLLMLLSTLAVYTFWLVPLLCMIGTVACRVVGKAASSR